MSGIADPRRDGSVFPDQATEHIWRGRWCATCFNQANVLQRQFHHGPGCPILAQALAGTVPPQWERGDRATAVEPYTCSAYLDKPVAVRVPKEPPLPQQELFAEPEHEDKKLLPVPGWPDRRAFDRRAK